MKLLFPLLLFAATLNTSAANEIPGFKNNYPTQETIDETSNNKVFQRALDAYHFWYPTVSSEGIMNGGREMGLKDNENFFSLQSSSKVLAFTANIDTPYGGGTLDLKDGPVVIEMPPGAFMGLVNDHNQGWIMDMGLPGPDAGKGGKHIIVPPGYKGEIPAGHFVGRSSTNKVLVAVRVIPKTDDMFAAQKELNDIKVYPYSSASNPKLTKFVNLNGKSGDLSSLKWEDNIAFWEKLHKVINEEPMNKELSQMYMTLALLGIEKGKAFSPDEKMKSVLELAAKEGQKQMLVSAFAQTWRQDRVTWKDRKWEWLTLVPGSGNFEGKNGVDYDARDRYFSQAIVMSPAMTRRDAGAGSLYWGAYKDKNGEFLDGGKTYKLVVPLPVPAKLFWSVTLYDADTRSLINNDQISGLRSKVELQDLPKAGSVELYFGPKAPAGKEDRWVRTTPGKGWFSYVRIYGPEKGAFDQKWKLGDFEEVKDVNQTASR